MIDYLQPTYTNKICLNSPRIDQIQPGEVWSFINIKRQSDGLIYTCFNEVYFMWAFFFLLIEQDKNGGMGSSPTLDLMNYNYLVTT